MASVCVDINMWECVCVDIYCGKVFVDINMWECVCVDIYCGKCLCLYQHVGMCLCRYLLWQVFVLISTCGNVFV